ncbi:hypothetical protein CHS0354_037313 [Potamilus streckersoni]|uniref:Importin-13 n=1 Tax=Potamilus streckersoni TaxID=2493646 RepID=A0AAE0TKP5_9BIVA|nr:hypothetical protein CHS0354_037313 [Potamilus streckersoni]
MASVASSSAVGTEFTSANVEKAVCDFYCNACVHHEVHMWLTVAQVSPQAWTFSWDLLAPEKDVQVQFFGASCLLVKISKYWNEIPVDHYNALRTQLLEKIVHFAQGPKIVLTRLCIALSSLALNTMPDFWKDPVHSLINTFQQETSINLDSTLRCTVLLELLTVLPEEFFSSNLAQNRRAQLRNELTKALPHILLLLENLMSPNSPAAVYDASLKCFSSWVQFGIVLNESESIILHVFASLQNPLLFDTAVDTLVNIFSHPDAQRFPYTIHKLMPVLLQLRDILNKAIEKFDMDTCQGVTQVVVAVAENHIKMLIDGTLSPEEEKKLQTLSFIELILSCTSVPGYFPMDEVCSNMTFTFWYILQDALLEQDKEKYYSLLPIFQPIYLKLIEHLLIKVQFPTDEVYDDWDDDEKEQFRCYRQDIGDTMMYAYGILKEPLLGYMYSALSGIINGSKEVEIRWQLMEAIFFLFSSVAEGIDIEENLFLPSLLDLLPRVPFNNIKFLSTALYMIGSLGEWMNSHPECLAKVIPLILQGLRNSEVATAATLALKDITRENMDHIYPYLQQILQASQSSLQSGVLKSREVVRLMSCIGQVLSILPFEEIMQNLSPILSPHLQELQQLVSEEPSPSVKAPLLLKLNMLSWLFATLDTERETRGNQENMVLEKKQKPRSQGPKPVFVLLQEIAPTLQTLVTKWISDPSVVEAVCELFKRTLQTLMDDFAPLAKDVSQLLSQMYQTVPHVSIVDLTKQLIIMFHADSRFAPVVQVLLGSVVSKTLQLFQSDVQMYTDVVEGFMTLMSQILKKTKHLILNGSFNLSEVFQAAVIGMSMAESHTVKASCLFLAELLAQSSVPAVKEIVVANGQVLLDRILRSIGGEAPRMVTEHLADVLFVLSKHHSEYVRTWFHEFVEKEGYPSVRVTKTDKENFTKAILRERGNKRKLRELVKEFTLLCRGLLGTEYAAQMVAMM